MTSILINNRRLSDTIGKIFCSLALPDKGDRDNPISESAIQTQIQSCGLNYGDMKTIALIVIGYLILILIFIFRMYFYKKTSKSYVSVNKSVSRFYVWIFISIATFFLVFLLIGQSKKISIENDLDLLKSENNLTKIEMHCAKDINGIFTCKKITITDSVKINKY
ncbi:hypothetical protein SDC9_51644 [bioreactor metagenome]|uniref:Uncharacterized protein n=1 Tax=bioreactor metagenome TaxID=1076179 RepID=A0A644WN58_9ZZZZ